jgi:hypothetical protein
MLPVKKVPRRTQRLRERLTGWSAESSAAAKMIAENFPSNLTLPQLVRLVNLMINEIGNPKMKLDGIDVRSVASVLHFMDRWWGAFSIELPHWYCADSNFNPIDPK